MNRNEFFQALPITRLALKLTGATLEICTDDIEDIHVMVSGGQTDTETLRISAASDTLTVEQPVSAMARSATSAGSWLQLAIRLPRTWKGAIEARTVTGWMNIRSVSGTDLSLDSVSGMIMGSDLSFITLSARSVTGDVKLTQTGCSRCSLFSTSGSLIADSMQLSTGTASTVTGLISLALLSPFEELSLNSVTGDLSVDAPIIECDAVLRSVSGRIRTGGVSITEGAAKLRATTVSSDLDIACNLE
ncbi:MAG: DUF4097 family beta strand repeat protein [Clostridia bacterium]|nr:DUF4097 family beta strand repeat protein [Clostridia bacterium]